MTRLYSPCVKDFFKFHIDLHKMDFQDVLTKEQLVSAVITFCFDFLFCLAFIENVF